MWVVGVGYKDGQKDPLGENTKGDMLELGFSKVSNVETLQTYLIEGDVGKEDVEKIGRELLADNVIQFFNFGRSGKDGEHIRNLIGKKDVWIVEVFFKHGVMDPVGLSVERALDVLGIKKARTNTGTIYIISGDISEEELKDICNKALVNEMIQTYRYHRL